MFAIPGSRIWWSFEDALDSENEVPSAPTQECARANPEYMKGKEKLNEKKKSPFTPIARSSRTRAPKSPQFGKATNM